MLGAGVLVAPLRDSVTAYIVTVTYGPLLVLMTCTSANFLAGVAPVVILVLVLVVYPIAAEFVLMIAFPEKVKRCMRAVFKVKLKVTIPTRVQQSCPLKMKGMSRRSSAKMVVFSH